MANLIVKDGILDLGSVEQLSQKELSTWIFERLHGQDYVVPGDARQGLMPYSIFAAIYPKLDRRVRQDIDNIVAKFVRDMACMQPTAWTGDAAHNLLLLAHMIG